MLKENSKVKVHFCNPSKFPSFEGEALTNIHNTIFEVKKQNGTLGIDYNTHRSPYINHGELFSPFRSFSWSVIFENVETGKLYHYSNITEKIEQVTEA